MRKFSTWRGLADQRFERENMGFFSWECRHCRRSILSEYSAEPAFSWMVQAVVLTPENEMLSGEYDGYGRIDERSILDLTDAPEVYHSACWVVAGAPKTYTEPSDRAADQGFFFEPEDYLMCTGPVSAKASGVLPWEQEFLDALPEELRPYARFRKGRGGMEVSLSNFFVFFFTQANGRWAMLPTLPEVFEGDTEEDQVERLQCYTSSDTLEGILRRFQAECRNSAQVLSWLSRKLDP